MLFFGENHYVYPKIIFVCVLYTMSKGTRRRTVRRTRGRKRWGGDAAPAPVKDAAAPVKDAAAPAPVKDAAPAPGDNAAAVKVKDAAPVKPAPSFWDMFKVGGGRRRKSKKRSYKKSSCKKGWFW